MKRSRPFLNLMLADFVARSAYQMGKTPLLPIFRRGFGRVGRLPRFDRLGLNGDRPLA